MAGSCMPGCPAGVGFRLAAAAVIMPAAWLWAKYAACSGCAPVHGGIAGGPGIMPTGRTDASYCGDRAAGAAA